RCALHPALGEDVDLVMTMWAEEVAHVLHNAKYVDLDATEHFNCFARVLKGNIGRCRDNDCAGKGHSLEKRNHDVACPRRKINDEEVQLAPLHLLKKLLDDRVKHRPAPHQWTVAGTDESN